MQNVEVNSTKPMQPSLHPHTWPQNPCSHPYIHTPDHKTHAAILTSTHLTTKPMQPSLYIHTPDHKTHAAILTSTHLTIPHSAPQSSTPITTDIHPYTSTPFNYLFSLPVYYFELSLWWKYFPHGVNKLVYAGHMMHHLHITPQVCHCIK